MTKKDYYFEADMFATELISVDFNKMPISDYNKRYINRLKTALHYNFYIYAECFYRLTKESSKKPENITLVDFGGGSGFLSMLAKKCGFKKVIYVDINPLSTQTISYLRNYFHVGPDVILEGSADVLLDWTRKNQIVPDSLVATDLIEHIYNLEIFFHDLMMVNPSLNMVFTTGSNPYNLIKKKFLRRNMLGAEVGNLENPNYYTLRLEYIRQNYFSMTKDEQILWAKKSRGLVFEDIDKAINSKLALQPIDKYNTCDPRNGSWEERVLPLSQYKKIVQPYNCDIDVYSGFYYTDGTISLKKMILKGLNIIVKMTGKFGLIISPLMYLHIRKK